MALVIADRVKETTTTTGIGTLDLAGAVGGFVGFAAAVGNGNTCYYSIVHHASDEWEVGLGTITDAATDTLSRDSVLASSNGGAAVNFSAGMKDVFVTAPADILVTSWGDGLQFSSGEASVDEANVDHDALAGFVAAKHYDWTNETHDLATTGDIHIDADNSLVTWGTANDCGISYDGSDMIFDSQLIGSGDFYFKNGKVGINTNAPTGELTVKNSGADIDPLVSLYSNAGALVGEIRASTGCFFAGVASGWKNTGSNSTGFGYYSMIGVMTGHSHAGFGRSALQNATAAYACTAVGCETLKLTTTGSQLTGIGRSALRSNTTGELSTAVGAATLYDLVSGDRNTAIGANTGRGIITGNYNTIIGANVIGLAADLSNHVIIADGQGNQRFIADSSGNVKISGPLTIPERSADPDEPAEGECVIWMSNGTGSKGNDGDVLIASKAGGVTKWATLFDHSAGNAW